MLVQCRVKGPASSLPQGTSSREAGRGSFDCIYPTLLLGWVLALGKPQDTTPGMGKCSLRQTTGAGSMVPGPARMPGSSGSQGLGHPVTVGSLGRAENRVGVHRLDLAWGGGREEGENSGWYHGGVSLA